jgi:uncharacterized cupredoxin-like copper-binding protein
MHRNIPIVLLGALLAWAPASALSAKDDTRHAHSGTAAKKLRGAAEKPYGRPGDPRKVKRAITLNMSDTMRFFPDNLSVKRGDTVRFRLRNSGELPHELVLGTMDELKKHAAMMKQNPDMDHHGDVHAAHVKPGATASLVWQFTKPGEFYFACLVPGHFDAGMIGTIVVR